MPKNSIRYGHCEKNAKEKLRKPERPIEKIGRDFAEINALGGILDSSAERIAGGCDSHGFYHAEILKLNAKTVVGVMIK